MLEVKDPVLGYVREMVGSHLPDVDFNDNGEPELCFSLGALYTFVERYNTNKINSYFKYEDYKRNKDVQDTIEALDIDIEMFWYFLLFAYDFSYCQCFSGSLVKESPNEQLQNLIKAIYDNIKEDKAFSTLKSESKLTLSVKGKHNVVIDNPNAMIYLAKLCEEGLKNLDHHLTLSIVDYKTTSPESTSVFICYFTRILKSFFKIYVKIKRKARNGDTVSLSLLLLISRLVYFTKISTNKNLLATDDTLKQCLKEYKNHKIKSSNLEYFTSWYD